MADDANKEDLELDRMPGADLSDDPVESLDMNFGLGEEPVLEEEDEDEEEEEPVVAEEEPEVEEGDSEEPEAVIEDEESEAEPEQKQKRKPMVPKSRLDEVLAKQKALQKQLDDMMAQQQPAPDAPDEYDFESKEVEYQNLVLDGESAKAAALRQEIRRAERTQLQYEMTQQLQKNMSQNQQATALQQAASDLEANFPVFDRNSPDFNEAYTQEVIDLRDAFITKGENAVAALTKAAKYVLREYDLIDNTPSLSSAPTKQLDEVAKKRAEVSKKLKAANSQPPQMAGEGSTSHGEKPFDVNALSEDEFNSLPEATLKRLRGDIV